MFTRLGFVDVFLDTMGSPVSDKAAQTTAMIVAFVGQKNYLLLKLEELTLRLGTQVNPWDVFVILVIAVQLVSFKNVHLEKILWTVLVMKLEEIALVVAFVVNKYINISKKIKKFTVSSY